MTRRNDGFDLTGTVHDLRDNLARADAFISAAEYQLERLPWDGVEDEHEDSDDSLGRRRNHLAHLIDAAKLAVRAAVHAGSGVAAELDRRKDA